MISSILNSDKAILVNIQIIRVFTRLRQYLLNETELRLEIENIKAELHRQEKSLEVLFAALRRTYHQKSGKTKRKIRENESATNQTKVKMQIKLLC